MKNFIIPLLAFFMSVSIVASAQENNKEDVIKTAVESRNYVFKATTALPLRGRTVQLTSPYSLTVRKDSVVSYLPYFGRAYTAPIGKTSGGIEFTSTDFEYKSKQNKRGGWEIEIRPNDENEVRQMVLSVSKNGYGTLSVTSDNRQAISFNGYLEKEAKQ